VPKKTVAQHIAFHLRSSAFIGGKNCFGFLTCVLI
jgi:hypothetical protein